MCSYWATRRSLNMFPREQIHRDGYPTSWEAFPKCRRLLIRAREFGTQLFGSTNHRQHPGNFATYEQLLCGTDL